jgi:hypothetical protein
MTEFAMGLLMFACIWALLFLWIGVPARMAKARNRNPGHWALVSMMGTPVLAIVLLLALDEQTKPDPQSQPQPQPKLP